MREVLITLALCIAFLSSGARAEFNSVSASPNVLFVNTATNVKFVADVKPDAKLITSSVRLLRETAGIWSVVGAMRDDGLNGDAVAGDRQFTIVTTVQNTTLTTLNFRASAAYSGSVQRTQSSILALEVVAALDLDVEAGQQEITLLVGESVSTAFTIQALNQAGGLATISTGQTISPAGGVAIVTDLPPNGFSTNQSNQTFLVQNKFTGNLPGDYTVELKGTLTASGKTAQASAITKIHVLPASGIGQLLGLTTYPGGIKTGTSANITFGAEYLVGTAKPTSVQLVEVTAQGVQLQVIGNMRDDGIAPDIGAGDSLFSTTAILAAGPAGTSRYFRAIAGFTSGGSAQSPIVALASLPYDIGFAPIAPSLIIPVPGSNERVMCNQLLIGFVLGTPLATINSVAASIGGTIVGVEPTINTYQIQFPCTTVVGLQAFMNVLNANPAILGAAPLGETITTRAADKESFQHYLNCPDDAFKSVQVVVKTVADAILEGKERASARQMETAMENESKSRAAEEKVAVH